MARETKIKEGFLYNIWKSQNFIHPLTTLNGDEITILNCGTLNEELAGPDFKNARIRIGNLTFVGDVEIDNSYSDWKAHGHNLDNKYNKVILHIALSNPNNYTHVFTRDGRKIPSIKLSSFIDKEQLDKLKTEQDNLTANENLFIKCQTLINGSSYDSKIKFITELGFQRFQKKCLKIYNRLKELEFVKELDLKEPIITYELTQQFHERNFEHKDFYDKNIWKQLFYEFVFEALGYSQNKVQMTNLAKHANINFLLKLDKDGIILDKYESILFHVAGLLNENINYEDEETKKYIERLKLNWNSYRSLYDNKFMNETEWNFFKQRPQNFPTIRIAGGARLLYQLIFNDLISQIEKKITEIHNPKVLINSLRTMMIVKADGYWKNHFVFGEKSKIEVNYFVGASRADEILVNVILPIFSVYFEVFGKKDLSKKILKVFSIFEHREENQIINNMITAMDVKEEARKALITQGLIELFRNWCSKNKCLECEIGKIVFN
ncbi:MAG: DUF2851 family protein [Melioribacteraceae bacterium]|nr:DUF2851 family protein [Melioribacteraceae bacterium]